MTSMQHENSPGIYVNILVEVSELPPTPPHVHQVFALVLSLCFASAVKYQEHRRSSGKGSTRAAPERASLYYAIIQLMAYPILLLMKAPT